MATFGLSFLRAFPWFVPAPRRVAHKEPIHGSPYSERTGTNWTFSSTIHSEEEGLFCAQRELFFVVAARATGNAWQMRLKPNVRLLFNSSDLELWVIFYFGLRNSFRVCRFFCTIWTSLLQPRKKPSVKMRCGFWVYNPKKPKIIDRCIPQISLADLPNLVLY